MRFEAAKSRLIDESGTQIGIVPTEQALEAARARGLDLVEVSPDATPPVTKNSRLWQVQVRPDA